MFTNKEENYILDTLSEIKDKTDKNNAMLRQIINVINKHVANSTQENINDFGMNVLANLISNNVDIRNLFHR